MKCQSQIQSFSFLSYSRILRTNGKLADAANILKSLDSSTNDIAVLKHNAYIAFDAGDYDAAELYVARVLQQTPNDLEFLLFRAKVLVEKKKIIIEGIKKRRAELTEAGEDFSHK